MLVSLLFIIFVNCLPDVVTCKTVIVDDTSLMCKAKKKNVDHLIKSVLTIEFKIPKISEYSPKFPSIFLTFPMLPKFSGILHPNLGRSPL